MNDVFETNAVTNLILNTTIPDGVEEMPNIAPYPNTMTTESSNALRKLFNALCGSVDEVLGFDIKSVESNSNHGVSKMLRFMIESLQNVNRNEEKDESCSWKDRKLYTWQANMDYVYACRKVAISTPSRSPVIVTAPLLTLRTCDIIRLRARVCTCTRIT